MKKLSHKIFSVKNKDIYKVITILGLEFKIKSQKLFEKEVQRKFEQQENEIKALRQHYNYKLCRYMPEEKYPEYLKDWFYRRTHTELNLENPQTFNEKIQWLKLYDSTPLKTRLADKYLVRDWVKEKIGEEYLIPLLGVWEKFDDIDFDKLPDKFVLKANHGCGWNIIVTDKNKFDKQEAKYKFDEWLHTNFAYTQGLELHYRDIKPLIIAEEYLESVDKSALDYKFMCFGGKPELCWVSNKYGDVQERSFYNMNWEMQNIQLIEKGKVQAKNPVLKPDNFDEMLDIVTKLCQGFVQVRVDIYKLNDGTLKFGEMTFTSASGTSKWSSYEIDKKLGDLTDLSQINNEPKQ